MRARAQLSLLAATAALLAGLIGVAAAQQPPRRPAEVPDLPAIEDLEATTERPLFTRTRRPPKAPPPPAVAEATPVTIPSEEAPADLNGIISGPDKVYAILTNRTTKETLYLGKGETIEDWNVQEIGPRHVVLNRGPGSMRLELFEEKEGKTAGDGEEAMRRPPPNRARFQQQQRQRPRQARQPNRRTRAE